MSSEILVNIPIRLLKILNVILSNLPIYPITYLQFRTKHL